MIVGFTGFLRAAVYPKAGFDLLRDFEPITALARVQSALVVNPERLDATTLEEFIAAARAKPGSIDIASAGSAPSRISRS